MHPPRRKGSNLSLASKPLLSLRIRVLNTQILAYMLDSLVRVSRLVDENHFVRIAKTLISPLAVRGTTNSNVTVEESCFTQAQGKMTI